MTDGDRRFLAPAGLHLVNVGDRDADSGENVCRRLADLEARRKNGIMSRNRYFTVLGHAAAANAYDFFESRVHKFKSSQMSALLCACGRGLSRQVARIASERAKALKGAGSIKSR